MEKIDWHKPLRLARHTIEPGCEEPRVYTYKSGKTRVVWVDDRVYPVDHHGCAIADVSYPHYRAVTLGMHLVENVPEEPECFVGLERQRDGTYVLYNDGRPGTSQEAWDAACQPRPLRTQWWRVDTRKSAELPAAIEHDPKDWTTVRIVGAAHTESFGLMTEAQAKDKAATFGGVAVRLRTTPAPVDTSRYVQLFRQKGSNEPWKINSAETQEGSWKEIQGWKAGCGIMEFVDIKVRD